MATADPGAKPVPVKAPDGSTKYYSVAAHDEAGDPGHLHEYGTPGNFTKKVFVKDQDQGISTNSYGTDGPQTTTPVVAAPAPPASGTTLLVADPGQHNTLAATTPVAAPAPAPVPAPTPAPALPFGGVVGIPDEPVPGVASSSGPAQPSTPAPAAPTHPTTAAVNAGTPVIGTPTSGGQTPNGTGGTAAPQTFHDNRGTYTIGAAKTDSHNNPGVWHDYTDGTKIFVADHHAPTITGSTPQSTTSSIVDIGHNPVGKTLSENVVAPPFGSAPVIGSPAAPIQVLAGGTEAPASAVSADHAVQSMQANGSSLYTVVHGDTLSGIAAAQGISLAQLEALNPQLGPAGGRDFDLIHPGDTVHIDDGGASSPEHSTYERFTGAGSGNQIIFSNQSPGWTPGTSNIPPDPGQGAVSTPSHHNTSDSSGSSHLIVSQPS